MHMDYPREEPQIRFSAIRRAMEESELDVLIVFSTQWKPEYVHYVSNYRLLGNTACAVLPLLQEATLLVSEPWDEDRARSEGWIPKVFSAPVNIAGEAGRVARAAGKRIGVAGLELLSRSEYQALCKALGGIEPANSLKLLDRVAMTKTAWELDILRRCASFADHGFCAELAAIRPGISEYELAAEIEYAMRSRGADDNFQMIAIGKNLTGMNVAREKCLLPGDFVLTETTPLVGCITYATQLCRTGKLGEASKLERDTYKMLVEALDSALAAMKPGVPMGEIARRQIRWIHCGMGQQTHEPTSRFGFRVSWDDVVGVRSWHDARTSYRCDDRSVYHWLFYELD